MNSSVVESTSHELQPDSNDSPRSPVFASPCASNSATSQASDSEYFPAKEILLNDSNRDVTEAGLPPSGDSSSLVASANHVDATADMNRTIDVGDVTLMDNSLDDTVVDAFNNTIMSALDDASDVTSPQQQANHQSEETLDESLKDEQAGPEKPCDNDEHSGTNDDDDVTRTPSKERLAQAEGVTPPSSKKNKSSGKKSLVKVTTIKRGKGKNILQDMNANTGGGAFDNSTASPEKTTQVPVT